MVHKVIVPLIVGLAITAGVAAQQSTQSPAAQPVQSPAAQRAPAAQPPAAQPAQTGAQQPPPPVTAWVPVTVPAEPIDADMNAKLRAEGLERSKVMWITHYLADVYGPRPTGSPNHVAAADWAIKTMTSWGMTNAHREPFTWRGIGWLPGRATGFITSPVKANLKFEALPWSPSTKGTVSGEVVHILPPVDPTDAELTTFLVALAPKVKNGIVMVGPPPNAPVNFNEAQKRTPDDTVRARFAPPDPNGRGGRGGRGGGPARGGATPPTTPPGRLTAAQVTARINTFLRDNPPALRLVSTGAGRTPGVIVAQNGSGQQYDEAGQICPGVLLRIDDYGRIARLIADGTPVTVEFNMTNQYFPEGKTTYVTVGEIRGTDKADEVVMLGGHLDSWTSATGATDNAIGSAIMLEAARILTAVGAKPRRTIRVALWSGEEQGLLGSLNYVKEHFGMAESPKPDHAKFNGYWNIDDGTGRVRSLSVFGPPEAGIILSQIVKPFEEWGVYGATTTTSRATGGTDSTSFNEAGLPGIGSQLDPIEYNSTTWHTNLDNYERIVPDDVMKNAVLSASLVYHLAMRDAMLPRFPADRMPPMPSAAAAAGRAGGPAQSPQGPQGPQGEGRGGRGAAGPQPADSHVFVAERNKPLAVAVPGVLPFQGAVNPGTPAPPARSAAAVAAPSNGKVAIRPDGSFTYTPNDGFTGTDTFTYTSTVGGVTSAPGTVTVVVR
jgi:hypothetical protein